MLQYDKTSNEKVGKICQFNLSHKEKSFPYKSHTDEMRKRYVLPGGDAIPGGARVEALSWSFQDGAVSSEFVENHTGVNGSCADCGVLQHFHISHVIIIS